MKLASLFSLASVVGSALASSGSTRVWSITSVNAVKPDTVLGKHQDFIKVWTIKGSVPVGAIQLNAAGSVFIDYDDTLNNAVTPVPSTEAPTDAPTTQPPTEAPTTVPPTEAPTDAPTTQPPTDAPTTTTPPAPTSSTPTASSLGGAVTLAAENDKIVAKVVFSGNCTDLLDEFEVVENRGALKIHFKNQNFEGMGYILTQIVVGEKDALASISSRGSNGIYLSEGVVASNGKAPDFSVSGAGDVFVTAPKTNFTLESLNVKVSGSSNIQFHAASLTVKGTISTKVSGDATIAIVADTIEVSDTIQSKVSGQGQVYYQAASVITSTIDTKISGDANVTISTNGTCESQDISISGQGNVATASILCKDTKIKMSGDGNVLVQTSGTLTVPHEVDRKIHYWGPTPQSITDGRPPRPPHVRPPRPPRCGRKHHGWWWSGWWGDDDCDDDSDDHNDHEDEDSDRYLPKSVTSVPENTYSTYELHDVPARDASFLILTVRKSRWGGDPSERIIVSLLGWDIDIGGGSASVSDSINQFAVRGDKTHSPLAAALLGVVAVGVVAAVGAAIHNSVLRRRRRREYEPLLTVVAH